MRNAAGLSDRIKKLIEVAGSLRALGRICKVSDGTVKGWRDGSDPYLSTIQKICDHTGVPLKWLRDGQGHEAAIVEMFQQRIAEAAGLMGSNARELLKAARIKAGLDYQTLGKKIGRDPGYLEALENTAPLSEATAELLAIHLPITKEELMYGSDSVTVMSEGVHGTYGAKSRIAMPPGEKGRNVPLLSHAEAGPVDADHSDAYYDHMGVFAPNLDDRSGFAIEVHGTSMEPKLMNGDYVICSPRAALQNGDAAVVRTHSGPVFIKYYTQIKERVILESENKTLFKPLEFPLSDIAGAWVIVGRVGSGKIKKEGFAPLALLEETRKKN